MEKTNVIRLLEQKKIPYTAPTYEADATKTGEEIAALLNEDAERVFGKAVGRIADTADLFSLQIFHTAVQVDQALFLIIGHGIDREVTAQQVFFQPAGKGHAVGMAGV